MDHCMKTKFARLFGGPGWVGVDTKIILKKFRMFLMTLFLLGVCSNGYAQEEAISLPADPLTDEYYQAYRWFYYDSYYMMLEVIGNETSTLPLDDFSKLSLESQSNVCLVSIDYIRFRSTTMKAIIKILEGRPLGTLAIRVFADVAKISWDFERELSEKEKDVIRQRNDFFRSEFKIRIENLEEKIIYCIRNRLVKTSGPHEFTEGYASVPMEFQVRDIYRSQVPLIRWLQENLSASEEKGNLQTMVESMERKYFVF